MNIEDLKTWVKQFDGKKRELPINAMINLFSEFEFTPTEKHGDYFNFGKGYGYKNKDFYISVNDKKYRLVNKIYSDCELNENTIYICEI